MVLNLNNLCCIFFSGVFKGAAAHSGGPGGHVTTERLLCPQTAVARAASNDKDRRILVASYIYTQFSTCVLASVRTKPDKTRVWQTLPLYNTNLVCTVLQLDRLCDIMKSNCATETNPTLPIFRCLGSLLLLGWFCMWQLLFLCSGPGPLPGTMKLLGAI